MITGKHKAELEELKVALANANEAFCQEKIKRMNAEADLHRARTGQDEETNEFFRTPPVMPKIEPLADDRAGTKLAKKPRAKKG